MQILITILHVVACFVLILVVLLQAGKGANMGAAFGGSSQTVFGTSGPGTFLSKMTTGIAVVFMITSLALSYAALHKGPSLVEQTAPPAQQAAPVPAEKAPTAGEQQTPPTQQK